MQIPERKGAARFWIAVAACVAAPLAAGIAIAWRDDPGYRATGVPTPLAKRFTVAMLGVRARLGSAGAQYALGNAYATVRGVGFDRSKAIRWYRSAAEKGHAEAQFSLGEMYAFDRTPEPREAIRWWRLAADGGHFNARYRLADSYARGLGVPLDPKEAVHWWRAMASGGYVPAKHDLAWALSVGWGAEQSQAAAVEIWRPLAERGDTESTCQLGLAYAAGAGVARDVSEALTLWRRAVDSRSVGTVQDCWYALCRALSSADGVERDYVEAARWCRSMVSQQGRIDESALRNPNASSYVAVRVSQRSVKAREARGILEDLMPSLLRMARTGNADAQWELALAYQHGIGLGRDSDEAMRWYRRAAAGGHLQAREVVSRADAKNARPVPPVSAFSR